MTASLSKHFQSLFTEMVEPLTLRQYEQLMGGDMSYKAKALRAKQVSKNATVHALADQIINLYDTQFGVGRITTAKIDLSDFE